MARCTPVNNAAKEHCLNSDLVQSGSFYTGQEEGTLGIKPGQSESMTCVLTVGWVAKDSQLLDC